MKRILFLSACVMTISIMSSCTSKQEKMEKRLKDFISAYEKNIVPLSCEASLASWNANVNGSDENWTAK